MLFKLRQRAGLLTMLLFSTISIGSQFPRGCEVMGYSYSDNYLILNHQGNQEFYLIQNRSNQTIILELYETQEVFMSPKLHSKLDPSSWSAFASDVQNQHFKCFTQDADNTAQVNCNEVLEVCQYPRVKFALSNMGNYWVSSNKEQRHVIKDAVAKGIFLHW